MHSHLKTHLLQDLVILVVSITATVILARSGAAEDFLASLSRAPTIAAIFAGFFFTSVITIAPAALALFKIAAVQPSLEVAFFGAFGAAFGDLILFLFVKKRIVQDIDDLVAQSKFKNILSVFRLELLRWLNPVLGMLIIVSPFPDEIGMAFLAFSKVRARVLFGFCLFFHFLGILAIITALKTLS